METRGRGSFCLTIYELDKISPDMPVSLAISKVIPSLGGKDHGSRVITLAEKLYRPIIALKPDGTEATAVAERLDAWLSGLPKHTIKSITYDRGKEFAQWKKL